MLKAKLTEEMKNAMRARDSLRLGMIRMLLSAIKNVEIDKGEQTDEQIVGILKTERKKMRDGIEQFEKAGRAETVIEEKSKLLVLEEFLPAEMDRGEIEKIVDEVISQSQDQSFGKIMGQVVAKTKGQADGRLVQEVVKEKLG